MFEGIFKLPAGHILTVGQGTWQVRQYWDQAADADVLREHLTDLLDRAVRARSMSDVPLARC